MDIDEADLQNVELADDSVDTWTFVRRKVLADLRTDRPRTAHPDDAAATTLLHMDPELQVLPDALSTSAYLREILVSEQAHEPMRGVKIQHSHQRSRMACRSALQAKHEIRQERLFFRHEVHMLAHIRAQEDGLRDPVIGEEDEDHLLERKLRAIHRSAVYKRVKERALLYREQETRNREAVQTLKREGFDTE
ncbi:unnamed protein product [Peniophora sp. CBMAI 1063]|nr:unnamed protein product [Peniophora sp. CBMAI 1063]